MNRGARVGIVAVTMGLLVAACGGGGDGSNVNAGSGTTTRSTVPPTTVAAPTTTASTAPATTTTSSIPPGTVVVNPLVTTTTKAPPPTTAPPTTTTKPPPSTTTTTTTPDTPAKKQAEALRKKLLLKLGASNRGVPDLLRFTVVYTPGAEVTVTWAINNGAAPLPTGTPTCEVTPPTSSTAPSSTTHGTQPTTTTKKPNPSSSGPTTTVDPASLSTAQLARFEAKEIVVVTKSRISHLTFNHLRLVGEYPLSAPADGKVVDVNYSHATVQTAKFAYQNAFHVPPVQTLTCIDPVFEVPAH